MIKQLWARGWADLVPYAIKGHCVREYTEGGVLYGGSRALAISIRRKPGSCISRPSERPLEV